MYAGDAAPSVGQPPARPGCAHDDPPQQHERRQPLPQLNRRGEADQDPDQQRSPRPHSAGQSENKERGEKQHRLWRVQVGRPIPERGCPPGRIDAAPAAKPASRLDRPQIRAASTQETAPVAIAASRATVSAASSPIHPPSRANGSNTSGSPGGWTSRKSRYGNTPSSSRPRSRSTRHRRTRSCPTGHRCARAGSTGSETRWRRAHRGQADRREPNGRMGDSSHTGATHVDPRRVWRATAQRHERTHECDQRSVALVVPTRVRRRRNSGPPCKRQLVVESATLVLREPFLARRSTPRRSASSSQPRISCGLSPAAPRRGRRGPASTSRSPRMSMHGTFWPWASRILFCIRLSESSTSTNRSRRPQHVGQLPRGIHVAVGDRDASWPAPAPARSGTPPRSARSGCR